MTDEKKKSKPVTKNGQVVSLPERPWNDKGTVLLEAGTRQNIRDTSHALGLASSSGMSRDMIMRILNDNLQRRREEREKKGTREERLRGLFGGGDKD